MVSLSQNRAERVPLASEARDIGIDQRRLCAASSGAKVKDRDTELLSLVG